MNTNTNHYDNGYDCVPAHEYGIEHAHTHEYEPGSHYVHTRTRRGHNR